MLNQMLALLMLLAWLALLFAARRQFAHIALLGFPGVVMHELMHLIMGLLLLARPSAMNLIPRQTGKRWYFGSVSFTGLNLLNAAPVTLAPLLLAGLAWAGFVDCLVPDVTARRWGMAALWSYLIACALFYCPPSTEDLRLGWKSAVFWCLVLVCGGWLWYLYRVQGHPGL